jgi:membrane-associated phospholipid phosphatase
VPLGFRSVALSGRQHGCSNSMSTDVVTEGDRFRIGEWLMFADYGALARRNMIVVWSCVAGLALVESMWLPMSRLTFDDATWPALVHSLLYIMAAYAFYVLVSHRLRNNDDRVAIWLRAALERFSLLVRSCIAIFAIGSVGLVFTYLATDAALPLRDGLLATLDMHLGFNWLSFLGTVNDHPRLARLLVAAYASTAPLTEGIIIWLTIRGSGERLSEFLALLCLASLGLAIGMLLVPAAGAFVYFAPPRHLFDNLAAQGEMWPFLDAFNALRNGSLTTIDVSSVQGVVSFPSFHTMLGILITYAIRDTRLLFVPVAAINALMIVSTLPVGGHYLADVIAGAAISAAAIYGMRREFPGRLPGLARDVHAPAPDTSPEWSGRVRPERP